jgi:CBS domain-containing protein
MLTLGDLMTADPHTLTPEMTLREAVDQLSHLGVSGAPVVAGSRLVGVISSADILDFASSNPGVPAHRPEQREWGEWETAELAEDDVSDPPADYFRDFWADSGAELVERFREGQGPEWDVLSEHVVGEVMTRRILGLSPEADAGDAARLMVGRSVHRLLVMDGEELVGIVSAMDFVRALAEERLHSKG